MSYYNNIITIKLLIAETDIDFSKCTYKFLRCFISQALQGMHHYDIKILVVRASMHYGRSEEVI